MIKIVPTKEKLAGLLKIQQQVYDLVLRRVDCKFNPNFLIPFIRLECTLNEQ